MILVLKLDIVCLFVCSCNYNLNIAVAFFVYRYTEDGHTVGEPEMTPPNPIRLEWELPQPVSNPFIR